MTAAEIRAGFLEFFRERGHAVVPSWPVIPPGDPTLLFTNAGMNQFKDVFLGTGRRDYTRAVNSQKCIRVSGKHNDLEEVGVDTYHHTFFEMLGNWSFGDYYKKEAIRWAWELLTGVWKLPAERLYATVYETDDEAAALWKSETAIDDRRVLRFGRKDNFWEMGETGPCGPCSEVHVDLTPDLSGGPLVNAGDPRVMEIWNLVFIQYDRQARQAGEADGRLLPLPATHVDTGMGLERVAAVLQNRRSNYDTDLFAPMLKRIEELARVKYTASLTSPSDIAMRAIADHSRMLAFSLSDGGIPSNEGRGYVIRRILRRAARFGRTLGLREPFLHQMIGSVADAMGGVYPEVREKLGHTTQIARSEEENFNATLDRGLEIFQTACAGLAPGAHFPPADAFRLYDTFGFPIDLTVQMARERGLTVDTAQVDALMETQKARSRSARAASASTASKGGQGAGPAEGVHDVEAARKFDAGGRADRSLFEGYTRVKGEGSVVGVDGNLVVLDRTPFYAESGGQVGDSGTLVSGASSMTVVDTQKSGSLIVHLLQSPVAVAEGATVTAAVDAGRRRRIELNHTATHLVHEALRRVLGNHLHQQGSLVTPDRLRFDVNHFEKIRPDQIRAVEIMVNEKIAEAIAVAALNDPADWLTVAEAKARYPNVKMFFGEKYGDRVRIVEIDPKFSVELCGGTHVRNTSELKFFKIVSETGTASGVRRIEAVTGEGFERHLNAVIAETREIGASVESLLKERDALASEAGTSVESHPKIEEPAPGGSSRSYSLAVEAEARLESARGAADLVRREISALRKRRDKLRAADAGDSLRNLAQGGETVDGHKVVAGRVEAAGMEEMKNYGDRMRAALGSGVALLGAVSGGKVLLVCVVTDDLAVPGGLDAGKIVREAAAIVGGSGGGRPGMATAGGKDPGKLPEALDRLPSIVRGMLVAK